MTLDSSTLVWIFVAMTLLPGCALLVGDRVSPGTRTAVILASGGTWLAAAVLVAGVAMAYNWSALLF